MNGAFGHVKTLSAGYMRVVVAVCPVGVYVLSSTGQTTMLTQCFLVRFHRRAALTSNSAHCFIASKQSINCQRSRQSLRFVELLSIQFWKRFSMPRPANGPMNSLFLESLGEAKPQEAALVREHAQSTGNQELVEAALEPIRPIMETYFAMEDPNRLEPYARELAMSVELDDGFAIRGFIDRVDRNPSGDIRIVDYKSGKSPSPRFADKAMFQMRFYGLAWWRINGELPRMLQLMYLGNGQMLKYEPSESDLLSTERKILALRSAITKSAERESFTPTPSKLCGWCSFKLLCPEFGGTPPPLPDRATWTSGSSLVQDSLNTASTLVINQHPE